LAQNYAQAVEANSPLFFGPFIGAYGDIYPSLSLVAPIFADNDGRLLGFAAIVDAMDAVFAITEEPTDLSDTLETYLVDKDRFLVSPIRQRDIDMFVQSVISENVDGCFELFDPERELQGKAKFLLNYRGDEVLGVHHLLSKVNWCVLAEITKEEAVDILAQKRLKNRIPLLMVAVLILTLIGFFTGRFLNKEN